VLRPVSIGCKLVRVDLPDFLAAARTLLAIESTAEHPDRLHDALRFVIDYVGPGFRTRRFESAGKPSALLWTGDRPRFRVLLNAHLDVVPAEPALFEPRLDGDRLLARGAQDMKLSGLVLAHVFRELRLPGVALQLVTDEEVGGRNGTGHQVEHGVTADFVIIGEHSGLCLVADSKGLLRARVRATGRGAHGAYPWLGENALLKITRAVDRLVSRYPVPAEAAWRTTVNVASISTPNLAHNQVPASAEAWLDVRFPAEEADGLEASLRGLCESEPGVEFVLEHLDAPHHTDHDLPDVVRLRQAARGQGYSGDFLYKHGAGDGRYYARIGVPAVVFGVGGDGQHGPHEYADLTTVEPYERALTDFLLAVRDTAPKV
jgi:succinyl-diaminopimelate desuccinylase